MNTNSSALIIPPSAQAPPAVTNDIRGLKPPVDLPHSWAWTLWLLAVLLLLALAAWARRFWRGQPSPALVIPVIPPHVRAKHKLQQALSCLSRPKEFCTLVSDTMRLYLEERFEFHAPERTTEEFLFELQDTDLLSPDQKQSLAEFLHSCDLVKFARFEPAETTLHELHASACRLVDETQPEPPNLTPSKSAVPHPVRRSPSESGPKQNEAKSSPETPVT
jgi:hypothetical protein